MALHNFANDFFRILGSEMTQGDIEELLRAEWKARCGDVPKQVGGGRSLGFFSQT